MKSILTAAFLLLSASLVFAQSPEYQEKKKQQLSGPSPFEKELADPNNERILYSDSLLVALRSINPQLPVHILIVPRKRIPTINDITEADASLIAHMMLVAKKMAAEAGVADSGYRLVFNTNEDAGQSVFHIHLHLLGGMKTGPMVDQTWRNRNK